MSTEYKTAEVTAEKTTITEQIVQTVEQPAVTLTVPWHIAETLLHVVGSIHGRDSGRQGHMNQVYHALRRAGVTSDLWSVASGTIRFND